MTALSPRLPVAGRFTLAIGLTLLPACGKLGPPEHFESSAVRGKVHLGPDPVRGGWIEFLPTGPARGHLRSAPIGPEGAFEATRVAVGPNAIRIVRAKGPIPLGTIFEQFHTTPIQRTIGPGPAVSIDIDLAREAFRRAPSPR